jgi:hypothetical protein
MLLIVRSVSDVAGRAYIMDDIYIWLYANVLSIRFNPLFFYRISIVVTPFLYQYCMIGVITIDGFPTT